VGKHLNDSARERGRQVHRQLINDVLASGPMHSACGCPLPERRAPRRVTPKILS
jgi:hypothetical protein